MKPNRLLIAIATLCLGLSARADVLSPTTLFGDVDGQTNTIEDVGLVVITNKSLMGVEGPYSPWTNDWAVTELTTRFPQEPYWNGQRWIFPFTNSVGTVYAYQQSLPDLNSTQETIGVNGTDCHFGRTGTTQYTNAYGLATLDNLKSYAKSAELENYVTKEGLDEYDASYNMSTTITYDNQTITFLNLANASPTNIVVPVPTKGRCRDWVIYVSANSAVSLTLPAHETKERVWWVPDATTTNEIPGGVATGLYFSQVAEYENFQIFTMSRREFMPIDFQSLQSTRVNQMREVLVKKRGRRAR